MTSFKKVIILYSIIISLFISGCGSSSSSSSSSDSQEVSFSDYVMTINAGFVSLPLTSITDHRINNSLVAAYSIPTPSKSFFEKNIIISQDELGTTSFDNYVNEAISGIKKTRGGYNTTTVTNETLLCNKQSLPAKRHLFTIQRGLLGETGQLLSFVQYFFAKSNKITIISSSTDDSNDLDALNGYIDSIQCMSGGVSSTGQ